MRKILKILWALALVGGGCLLALWLLSATRFGRALHIVSSTICENSPIAELATRKIVWRVFTVDRTIAKDSIRNTVYTIKIGYDLAAAESPRFNRETKTVIWSLPPPKILAIDDTLQRNVVETKTFFERAFGKNVDDGAAERQDLRQLAADCEKYALLSAESLRESIVTYLATRLRNECGYELVIEDGLSLPARVMFNAYFEEKGVGFRL